MGDGATDDSDVLLAKAEVRGRRKQVERAIVRRWKLFLAYTRWSKSAVCEMSKGLEGWADFHDYPDDVDGVPDHFHTLTCKRCGKEFTM